MVLIAGHSEKAASSMVAILAGSITEVNASHAANAHTPTNSTPSPKVMAVNFLAP